jgi:hypothetical protein
MAAADAVSAASATTSLHAATAHTAPAAIAAFATGVQDATIVPAAAIACAVPSTRRSGRRVKNVATNSYLKKSAVLDSNGAVQGAAKIWMSANCDELNHALDLENSFVCGNAVERNRSNAIERATRRKSRCESKCRFPNTGGLHRTSGDAPLETHPERAHELENSVVCDYAVKQNRGNAVERATRGKSGCESKCCFPNPGGLHCTSGDAPLETHPERAHELEHGLYAVMPLSETAVTPLSEPQGGSPDVKASVASQIPEDFTAHLEMSPLRHIHHLATCTILILHHLRELKLRQVPSESIEMNLQDIPPNTKGH